MTFCLGANLEEGLVGIADTRVTSGKEMITLRKLSVYKPAGGVMFVMTSGLRSVRDKTLTYFEEALETHEEPFGRLFNAVNLFAKQLRRVGTEDRASLRQGGLSFDSHALIGGQMENDSEHKLYMVYPEGNWVEAGRATPYQVIGSTGYGKPILDRALTYEDPLRYALQVGCLAFDSTRISAADVGFPIDVVLYRKGSFEMVEHRYEEKDLAQLSRYWQEQVRRGVHDLPSEWVEPAFSKLDGVHPERPAAD
jgi:putative proteasome-type protease